MILHMCVLLFILKKKNMFSGKVSEFKVSKVICWGRKKGRSENKVFVVF